MQHRHLIRNETEENGQIKSEFIVHACLALFPHKAYLLAATIAMATPMYPKKGAKDGQESKSRSRLVFDMFQDKLGKRDKKGQRTRVSAWMFLKY